MLPIDLSLQDLELSVSSNPLAQNLIFSVFFVRVVTFVDEWNESGLEMLKGAIRVDPECFSETTYMVLLIAF